MTAREKAPPAEAGGKAGPAAAGREVRFTCCDGVELQEALSAALCGREHVVMVRVNQETLDSLDCLVDAGLCSSRSGAAAFLMAQGVEANRELLAKAREVTGQIVALRAQLRDLAGPKVEGGGEGGGAVEGGRGGAAGGAPGGRPRLPAPEKTLEP